MNTIHHREHQTPTRLHNHTLLYLQLYALAKTRQARTPGISLSLRPIRSVFIFKRKFWWLHLLGNLELNECLRVYCSLVYAAVSV